MKAVKKYDIVLGNISGSKAKRLSAKRLSSQQSFGSSSLVENGAKILITTDLRIYFEPNHAFLVC